jgi:hypothetical protein
MIDSRVHAVQVDFTSEEWRVMRALAELRGVGSSDFLREALHLPPLEQALTISPSQRSGPTSELR